MFDSRKTEGVIHMAEENTDNPIWTDTYKALERLQQFDVSALPREDVLGSELNFSAAVPDAKRLIGLFSQISLTSLADLPNPHLESIKNQANAAYNRFEEILAFTQKDANAFDRRNSLLKQLDSSYDGVFNKLHPLISYSTSRSADFKGLETQARAALQAMEDQATALVSQLERDKTTASSVLEEIRQVAGEQGVSQQAYYFSEEAKHHDDEAESWRKTTTKMAWLMGAYAALSLFLHKIPWLAPASTYDSIQLAVSKMLIFAVISYMLYLAARNFLSHKHNAIVNKHRQNALVTYKALADAAKDDDKKDIILANASSCIFSPQSTGYSRVGSSSAPSAKSVVELLTKPFSPDE
jgi:hypothetical protein